MTKAEEPVVDETSVTLKDAKDDVVYAESGESEVSYRVPTDFMAALIPRGGG